MISKISKLIRGLWLLIRKPWYINLILEDNEIWKRRFIKKYPQFSKGLPLVDLQDICCSDDFTIPCFSMLDGGSMPGDYALLRELAKNIPDCDYFEIGTWRGESAANVADNARSCTTINLNDDRLRKMGYSENTLAQIGFYIKSKTNIELIRCKSSEFPFAEKNKKYDLVFIDGDHHYKSVQEDTKNIFKNLMKDSTIVVWHDYTFFPDSIRYEVFMAIMDALQPWQHKKLLHVRNTNCAVFHCGNFTTETLQNPSDPKYNFQFHISSVKNDI